MSGFGEQVVQKEFSPEQAGHRVGWSAVMMVPRDDERLPYYTASIVAATVGEEGAVLSYHPFQDKGREGRGLSRDSAQGFEDVVAVSAIIGHAMDSSIPPAGKNISGNWFTNGEEEGPAGLLMQGAYVPHGRELPDELMIWGDNPADILKGLKKGLAHIYQERAYDDLYYLFNGYTGYHNTDAQKNLFLADPEQQKTTVEQFNTARKIAGLLHDSFVLDLQVKTLLSPLHEDPNVDLVKEFTDLRRTAHTNEAAVHERAMKLRTPYMAYLPIGFRPSGRSWPYMDAGVEDEDTAFGLELKDLQAGNPQRARVELAREIDELGQREKYTNAYVSSLGRLAQAERDAAE